MLSLALLGITEEFCCEVPVVLQRRYAGAVSVSAQGEWLIRRFQAVRSRRAGVALGLSGQPGIGKTHLAREVLLHLSCRSLSVPATVSFRALLLALPDAHQRPAWVDPVFEQITRGAAVAPALLQDAVSAHLQAVSPFVLHVEDLHEASADQQRFWSALALAVTRLKGVGLLVTSRSALPDFETLPVTALNPTEDAALLVAEAGADLPPAALAWIFERACGNPLFTREYFRLLTRRGSLWSDSRVWRWREPEPGTHPPTVEALISERLSAVGNEAALRLLDVLTLLPGDFREPASGVSPAAQRDAARIAGLEPGTAELARETLVRTGILDQCGFAHPLYRELHRAALPEWRQRTVAVAAITHFSNQPEAAASFVERADLPDDVAVRLLRVAASSARRRGDPGQEARFLWEASARVRGGRRAALADRAARVSGPLDQAQARRYARAAYEAAPTGRTVATLALALAHCGESAQARVLLEDHRQATPEWTRLCLEVQVISGDDRSAVDTWTMLCEQHSPATPDAYALAASAFLNLGELAQAQTTARQGLERAPLRDSARARMLNVLAGAAYFQGEFTSAQAWQDEAIAHWLARTQPAEAAGIIGNRALVRAAQGQTLLAVADLEAAMRLHAQAGQGRQFAFQQQRLGALLARTGDWERAEEQLLEARAVLARTEMLGWQAECEGELAKLYLEWSPLWGGPRALRHARGALMTARQLQNPAVLIDALFVCSWAESQHGVTEAALSLAAELSELAPAGASVGQGYAHWVTGLALHAARRQPEACAALEASRMTFQAAGIEVLAQRVQLDCGRLSRDLELIARSVRYFEERGLPGRAAAGYRALADDSASPAMSATPRNGDHTDGPELRLLGPLEVWNQGVRQSVRGPQTRRLLTLLGEAALLKQGEVAQLTLTDLLYPELPERSGVAALQQLIHRLRAVAGPDMVVRGARGYALGPTVRLDAATFLKTADAALWRGPYLEGEVDSAAAPLLYDALRATMSSQPGGSTAQAVFLAELMLNANPLDRETLRYTLQTLQRARAYRKLSRTYSRARHLFLSLGETLPEGWQQYLAVAAVAG